MRRLKRVFLYLIEDFLRPFSGSLGIVLRRHYYRHRLKRCGTNLHIAPGVFLENPEYISLGDWVWIDKNVVIHAGPASDAGPVKVIDNPQCRAGPGEVVIGDRCHISIGCVIQGHGGVSIGHAFGAGTGSLIYSMSNSLYTTKEGPVAAAGSPLARIRTPVAIGNNVWLGLNVIVIGNVIEDDCFIKPLSIVTANVPANSIASGSPAQREKQRYTE